MASVGTGQNDDSGAKKGTPVQSVADEEANHAEDITRYIQTQKLKIKHDLATKLKALAEGHLTAYNAEERRWKQWDLEQKTLIALEVKLNNTRSVWLKQKWAKLKYLCSSRRMYSDDLHFQSQLLKNGELAVKKRLLMDEARVQLRRLEELEGPKEYKDCSARFYEYEMKLAALGRKYMEEFSKVRERGLLRRGNLDPELPLYYEFDST
ncbi:hypothetical protein QBC46DRAFT_412880 [Diplogelasinospora grovesii]|uniref:Uncharacterized protein n=1 Tax=Diplogelasinospora grovesii TaxID=303347 RepID=A0AAN6MYC2_9PEZI|nr:hypothetical protein QBC46DRAFT_412880 [Diplogelasinospora grovesii]